MLVSLATETGKKMTPKLTEFLQAKFLQVAKREKEDEIYTLERKYESKSICYVIISVATRNLYRLDDSVFFPISPL